MISGGVAAAAAVALGLSVLPADAASLDGIDVSHYQGGVKWAAVASAGTEFVYIKATQRTNFTDSKFDVNYTAAYRAGIIRGAYHFAEPDQSTGAAQAEYFHRNGGGWSADGKTLPGALDLEDANGHPPCYGMSVVATREWIKSFLDRYEQLTGRYAVIYTTTSWWKSCTGNYAGFASKHPLWIARYNSSVGALPAGWNTWTFWQYTSKGKSPGVSGNVDGNHFNGARARLLALANNTP